MSKKSLINKKALRYIIANSNLCKHAIRELELAGYSKEEDGPNKWMREQVIEAVALFSSHGNSGFSAPFEINLVKKLCSFDIISPLRFDDGCSRKDKGVVSVMVQGGGEISREA